MPAPPNSPGWYCASRPAASAVIRCFTSSPGSSLSRRVRPPTIASSAAPGSSGHCTADRRIAPTAATPDRRYPSPTPLRPHRYPSPRSGSRRWFVLLHLERSVRNWNLLDCFWPGRTRYSARGRWNKRQAQVRRPPNIRIRIAISRNIHTIDTCMRSDVTRPRTNIRLHKRCGPCRTASGRNHQSHLDRSISGSA